MAQEVSETDDNITRSGWKACLDVGEGGRGSGSALAEARVRKGIIASIRGDPRVDDLPGGRAVGGFNQRDLVLDPGDRPTGG